MGWKGSRSEISARRGNEPRRSPCTLGRKPESLEAGEGELAVQGQPSRAKTRRSEPNEPNEPSEATWIQERCQVIDCRWPPIREHPRTAAPTPHDLLLSFSLSLSFSYLLSLFLPPFDLYSSFLSLFLSLQKKPADKSYFRDSFINRLWQFIILVPSGVALASMVTCASDLRRLFESITSILVDVRNVSDAMQLCTFNWSILEVSELCYL